MTPLEALRAIGCTDEEIRTYANRLDARGATAERHDQWAVEVPPASAHHRIIAAVLRAAEQLGPEREWVTRDTPLGTVIGGTPAGPVFLVGWSGDRLVYERSDGALCRSTPVGWYVVKGAEG